MRMDNGHHQGTDRWVGLKGLDLYKLSIKFHHDWIREDMFFKAFKILHFIKRWKFIGLDY